MKTSALKLSDDVFIMQTNVGVLTFMSMVDIMFSRIEHILYTPRCRGRPEGRRPSAIVHQVVHGTEG